MVLQIRPERSQVWLEFPGDRDSGHGAKGYVYLLLSGYFCVCKGCFLVCLYYDSIVIVDQRGVRFEWMINNGLLLGLVFNDVGWCSGCKLSLSKIMALWWEKETRIGAWDITKAKCVAMAQFHGSLCRFRKELKSGTISAFNTMVYWLCYRCRISSSGTSLQVSQNRFFCIKYYDFSSNEVDYPSHAGMYRYCKCPICSRSV